MEQVNKILEQKAVRITPMRQLLLEHFVDKKCKQVTCIDSQLIPALDLPDGYVQQEVSMMIKGICPNCQG